MGGKAAKIRPIDQKRGNNEETRKIKNIRSKAEKKGSTLEKRKGRQTQFKTLTQRSLGKGESIKTTRFQEGKKKVGKSPPPASKPEAALTGRPERTSRKSPVEKRVKPLTLRWNCSVVSPVRVPGPSPPNGPSQKAE